VIVSVGDIQYWDYEYSIDGINYQDSTFTGLLSGDYIVYVKDKNECGIVNQEFYLGTQNTLPKYRWVQ
jgi:hypothetical protein